MLESRVHWQAWAHRGPLGLTFACELAGGAERMSNPLHGIQKSDSLDYIEQGFCSLVSAIDSSGSFAPGIAAPSSSVSHWSFALPLALTVKGYASCMSW